MQSPNLRYLPAVDHLRGIAALLILLYHGMHGFSFQMQFKTPFTYEKGWPDANLFSALLIEGHIAVALFMVLSGFIFTAAALNQHIHYGAFLKNRLLRTAPLVVLMLTLAVVTRPERLSVAGIINALTLGPLREPGPNGWVEHYFSGGSYTSMFWAITVEWHFYLLFPFLSRFLSQPDGPRRLFGFWLTIVILRTSATLMDFSPHLLSYSTILGRIDQFIAGMYLGYVWIHRAHWFAPAVGAIQRSAWGLGGLLLLSSYALWINAVGSFNYKGFGKVFWCSSDALVCVAFMLSYFKFCGNRAYWPLAKVGEMSYSIYLLHMVAAAIILHREWFLRPFANPDANATVTALLVLMPVTLAVSWLCYHNIEKPFLDLRQKYLSPLPKPD